MAFMERVAEGVAHLLAGFMGSERHRSFAVGVGQVVTQSRIGLRPAARFVGRAEPNHHWEGFAILLVDCEFDVRDCFVSLPWSATGFWWTTFKEHEHDRERSSAGQLTFVFAVRGYRVICPIKAPRNSTGLAFLGRARCWLLGRR
ncbi:MAG: hypothetical protein M2R46_04835 [Verrucomicrobia subdivision 3 bacterium]|nr:hypothetical protein [Limisphaerales bacterium]